MIRPTVTVFRRSGTAAVRGNFDQAVRALKQTDILIGIPQDQALRQGDQINNASLLFIQEHGSLLQNIPPRPVVGPGIQNSKALWSPELAAAAKALLDRQPQQVTLHLKRAGMIATNAVKRMFGSADLAPNAPSTIRKKRSSKPLIDSGLLRRSISFILRQGPAETAVDLDHATVSTPGAPSRSISGTVLADAEEAVTLGGEVI